MTTSNNTDSDEKNSSTADLYRRQALSVVGVASVGALSGCSGDGGDNDDEPDEDSTDEGSETDPEPDIQITDATLNTEELSSGEDIVVTVALENSGRAEGSANLELVVDGEIVVTEETMVPANEQTETTIRTQFSSSGAFEVELNDESLGEVRVRTPASFEIVGIDAPKAAELNEEFSVTVSVENVGEERGQWSGEVEFNSSFTPSPADRGWREESLSQSIEGEEVGEIERDFEFTKPGFLYYRLPDEDDIGEVETPGDRAPIITDAALVSEWNNFGDIEDNRIETGTTNGSIHIAFRRWNFVHEGTIATSQQAEIYDDDGDRITLEDYESEQITDGNGWSEWERAFFFSTDGWEPGEYTAEIVVRDDVTQDVSEGFRFEFEVTSEE